MKTKVTETKFEFLSPIGRETTYSNQQLSKEAKSVIEIDIDSNGKGSATWSVDELDIEVGIGLWFNGNTLTDYDGVFELPKQLLDKLTELGYDVEDML
jgi:hypothetical protein